MANQTAIDVTPKNVNSVPGNYEAVTLADESVGHVKNGLRKYSGNNGSHNLWHRRKSTSKQISLEMSSTQSGIPLHVLAGEGKLEELKSSIDAYDLTLKETDQNGYTLLHHAAAHNQVTVMQYLIDSGINLDDTDNDGNTALHLATSNECVEACHLLLSSSASDTVLNKELDAPLHIAARGKNKALAAILNHQVECSVLGYRSRTPLHVIAEFDNIEGVKIFNEKVMTSANKNQFKLGAADDDGLTPMHLAARKNAHRVLDFFLSACTKYSYSTESVLGFLDEENSTPLHAAVDSGNFEVAEVLLKHGASPIVSRGDLIPPLHLACSQGRAAMVKAMIELAGCEIVAHTDQHMRTPLHYCALSIHSSCMIPYIAERARSIVNINAQDDKGRTPLHNAITSANISGTTELLSYGANPMIKDKHGFNALHIAVHRNRKVIVSTLLGTPQAAELATAKSSTGYSALHLALRLGHGELIPGLISAVQCDIENCSRDDNGDNYLHLAAGRGDIKALKSLLDVPAIRKSLNEPNNIGSTPLHSGASSGHYRCIEILLNNGAMFHRCFAGKTAFIVACRKGYTDCAKLLLQAHPRQLHLTDDNGNSALHAAAQSKIPSMVTLILDEGCKLTMNSDSKSFFDLIIDTADFKCAMAVVNHDRWQECLDFYSPPQPCPMIGLIQQMPKVAKVVLDRCHSKAENLNKSHPDYWELFDFKYLLIRESDANTATTEQQSGLPDHPKLERFDSTFRPDFDESLLTTVQYKGNRQRRSVVSSEISKRKSSRVQCGSKTMVVLENMMAYKRENLLTHPVVNSFLSTKWKRYGRFIYNSFYMFQLLTVFLLSVFVLVIPNPVQVLSSASSTTVNQTDLNNTEPESFEISTGAQVLRAFILVLNTIFFAYIVFNLIICRSNAIKAFGHISLWIKLLTIFFNFVFLVAPNTLEIWPVGAVACFFSWLSLLFGLEYFAVTGTIVKMIVAVTKTVVLVLLMCVFMLLAFAFSFYILAGHLSEFSNVGYSFISVFGFMLGELPYESYIKEDVSGNLIYGKLFLVFILVLAVLMSIVIANLLIGLAIGDIERIKLNAILEKKATEIVYFTTLDRFLPKRYMQYILYTSYTHYPNAKKSIVGWIWQDGMKLINNVLDMETEKQTQTNGPCPTTTTDYVEEISELKRHILDLKETVQQLQDATSLHWRRSSLEQQSTVSLNSFDMDFMEDFSTNSSFETR